MKFNELVNDYTNKTCWICEEHENPFKYAEWYDGTKENPENFSVVEWISSMNGMKKQDVDDIHIECWHRENR